MLKSTLILFVETEVVIAVLPAKVTVLPSDTVKSVVASSRNVKELLALLLVSTASTLEDTTFILNLTGYKLQSHWQMQHLK